MVQASETHACSLLSIRNNKTVKNRMQQFLELNIFISIGLPNESSTFNRSKNEKTLCKNWGKNANEIAEKRWNVRIKWHSKMVKIDWGH